MFGLSLRGFLPTLIAVLFATFLIVAAPLAARYFELQALGVSAAAGGSESTAWLASAGEGLVAPACGSANAPTIFCSGSNSNVTISWSFDGVTQHGCAGARIRIQQFAGGSWQGISNITDFVSGKGCTDNHTFSGISYSNNPHRYIVEWYTDPNANAMESTGWRQFTSANCTAAPPPPPPPPPPPSPPAASGPNYTAGIDNPGQQVVNDDFYFRGTLYNIGTSNPGITFSAQFNVRPQGGGNIAALVTSVSGGVGVGENRITPPSNLINESTWTATAPGPYEVQLCNDSTDAVGETNETDNCSPWQAFNVAPPPPADLTVPIGRMQVNGTLQSGQNITFSGTILNSAPAGSQTAGPSTARFCIRNMNNSSHTSSDCGYGGGGYQQISDESVGSLAAGGETPLITSDSWTAQVGNYYFYLVADRPNDINEGANENNNSNGIAFTIAAPQCSDNIDNDTDGLNNAADPGCHSDGDASNGASYNPNDNDEGAPPAVTDIQATPRLVNPNSPSNLTWEATNVMSCGVTGTNGQSWQTNADASNRVEENGQNTNNLSQTTTFTIVCDDLDGGQTAPKSVTIFMNPNFQEL